MAIVQRGSKVYATIKDLPVVTALSDGMKFIMQADEGTVLVDYADLSVDLDHTTFGQTFMDMVNLTGTIEEFVNEVEAKIEDFDKKVETMSETIKQNSADIEALKYFIRLITAGPYQKGGLDDADAQNTFGVDTTEYKAWQSIYNNAIKETGLGDSGKFYGDFNLIS